MLWALYTSLKDLDGNLSLNLGGSADRRDGRDGRDFAEFPIPRLSGWLITPNPRDLARDKLKVDSDSLTRTTQNTSTILVNPKMGISEKLSGAKESDVLNTFLQTQW